MLSSLRSFKAFLNVFDPSDTTEDAYAVALVQAADRVLKGFFKQNFETQTYTLAHSGKDEVDLAIRQRPVQAPVFTCTLTNGSPTVTGLALVNTTQYPYAANGTQLSGTQNLSAGMPAAIAASSSANAKLTPLPVFTTVVSVDSPTQVTLNNNATQGGTFNVVFGIDVYFNPLSGRYGDSYQAFTSLNQLMLGLDYVLKRDRPDGSSKSGLIQRVGSGPVGAGIYGGWGFAGGGYMGGSTVASMTAQPLPRWLAGWGNVLITWTAGLGIGAAYPTGDLPALTTLDPDLTDAVNKLAAWMRYTVPRGAPLDSTATGDQARQQISQANPDDPLLGTVQSVVRRYREFAV